MDIDHQSKPDPFAEKHCGAKGDGGTMVKFSTAGNSGAIRCCCTEMPDSR